MSNATYKVTWNVARINQLKDEINACMITAAYATQNTAIRGAPYASGALQNSIRVDTTEQDQVFVLAGGEVGAKSIPYAKFREYNNRKNPHTRFYMRRAFEDLERNYLKYFKGKIK